MLYLLLSIFVGLFLVLLVIILRLCLDFQCGRPTEHHLANSNSIRKQSSPESPDGGTPSNPNVELIRYTYSVTTPNDYHSSQQQQQPQQQQPQQQQPHHQHYLYHTPPGSDGEKWTYNGGQPPRRRSRRGGHPSLRPLRRPVKTRRTRPPSRGRWAGSTRIPTDTTATGWIKWRLCSIGADRSTIPHVSVFSWIRIMKFCSTRYLYGIILYTEQWTIVNKKYLLFLL